jgi:hypothetical protein
MLKKKLAAPAFILFIEGLFERYQGAFDIHNNAAIPGQVDHAIWSKLPLPIANGAL